MKKILEGMRAGDLEDIVLPLISVDEYESKIDPKAIVFGFYVGDSSAANDLNRFIQKSPVSLLDTEVSPAPDQHGNYLVFIDILNNDRLPENAKQILDEIAPLVNISHWRMRIRGIDKLVDFSEEALKDHFRRKKAKNESVLNYLKASDLSNATLNGNKIVLERGTISESFELVAFEAFEQVCEKHNLAESALDLDMVAVAETQRLQRMLGESWNSSKIGGYNLIQRNDNNLALLLKKSQ